MPEPDDPDDPRLPHVAPVTDDPAEDPPPARPARSRRRLRVSGRNGRHRKRLSEVLAELAADIRRERISITDLLDLLRGRAMAALLLVFAVPNALPNLPGVSTVLGLPLVYLASQLMLGRKPWLPAPIARRSVTRQDFATMIARAGPLLARAERLLAPRLTVLVQGGAERAIGAVALILAIVLTLPIPLGNMLPALAICLLALGLLERDGLMVLAGLVVAMLSLVLVAGVVHAAVKAALYLLARAV